MNPVSPLFEKIDASIEKKANLFENSFSRYAVRAVLACLFLTLGTAVAFAIHNIPPIILKKIQANRILAALLKASLCRKTPTVI